MVPLTGRACFEMASSLSSFWLLSPDDLNVTLDNNFASEGPNLLIRITATVIFHNDWWYTGTFSQFRRKTIIRISYLIINCRFFFQICWIGIMNFLMAQIFTSVHELYERLYLYIIIKNFVPALSLSSMVSQFMQLFVLSWYGHRIILRRDCRP